MTYDDDGNITSETEYSGRGVSEDVISEVKYRYNPLWILLSERGEGEMSGRWLGDTITGSDIKPPDDFIDISDRL